MKPSIIASLAATARNTGVALLMMIGVVLVVLSGMAVLANLTVEPAPFAWSSVLGCFVAGLAAVAVSYLWDKCMGCEIRSAVAAPYNRIEAGFGSELRRHYQEARQTVSTDALQTIARLSGACNFEEALRKIDAELGVSPNDPALEVMKGATLTDLKRFPDVEQHYRRLLDGQPLGENATLVFQTNEVVAIAMQGDFQRARNLCDALLEQLSSSDHKVYLLDHLACIPIMMGLRGYLAEGEHWNLLALDLQPDNVTLKGTRGALLVELGRLDEARPLLEEVYATSKSDNDRAICAFCLALIAAKQAQPESRRRFIEQSLEHNPQPWLRERIASELSQ